MDEAFVLACKKLVVIGGAVGFSINDILDMLLVDRLTVDQLLDIIQQRLVGMEPPMAPKSITSRAVN